LVFQFSLFIDVLDGDVDVLQGLTDELAAMASFRMAFATQERYL